MANLESSSPEQPSQSQVAAAATQDSANNFLGDYEEGYESVDYEEVEESVDYEEADESVDYEEIDEYKEVEDSGHEPGAGKEEGGLSTSPSTAHNRVEQTYFSSPTSKAETTSPTPIQKPTLSTPLPTSTPTPTSTKRSVPVSTPSDTKQSEGACTSTVVVTAVTTPASDVFESSRLLSSELPALCDTHQHENASKLLAANLELDDEERLRKRRERFGITSPPTRAAVAPTGCSRQGKKRGGAEAHHYDGEIGASGWSARRVKQKPDNRGRYKGYSSSGNTRERRAENCNVSARRAKYSASGRESRYNGGFQGGNCGYGQSNCAWQRNAGMPVQDFYKSRRDRDTRGIGGRSSVDRSPERSERHGRGRKRGRREGDYKYGHGRFYSGTRWGESEARSWRSKRFREGGCYRDDGWY